MNPYSNHSLFGFYKVFVGRLALLLQGAPLASDEIQLLALSLLSLSCALVGTFLVLRKMTMLANALSHTILLGIVSAYLLFFVLGRHPYPLEGFSFPFLMVTAIGTGAVTAFLTQFLTQVTKLQEDASIGLLFTSLFALGIILVTLFTRNAHIGVDVVMGSIDAMTAHDCFLLFFVFCFNAVLFGLFFPRFMVTTFDSYFSRSLGISTTFFHYLLMLIASVTVVASFRAVGVVMVLAFLVIPPLMARLWVDRLLPLLGVACAVGVGATLLGVGLSRHLLTVGYPLSTSGVVVTLLAFCYLLALLGKSWYTRTMRKGAV